MQASVKVHDSVAQWVVFSFVVKNLSDGSQTVYDSYETTGFGSAISDLVVDGWYLTKSGTVYYPTFAFKVLPSGSSVYSEGVYRCYTSCMGSYNSGAGTYLTLSQDYLDTYDIYGNPTSWTISTPDASKTGFADLPNSRVLGIPTMDDPANDIFDLTYSDVTSPSYNTPQEQLETIPVDVPYLRPRRCSLGLQSRCVSNAMT